MFQPQKGTVLSAMGIISAGYIPPGIAFGSLAIALHVPPIYVISLSLFVYSGAVQSAFLGYWSYGIEPVSMILTAFMLNLRHTFYGAHIESTRENVRFRDIISIGPLLTDEIYAVSISYPSLGSRKILAISIYAYGNWALGTIIGITAATYAPEIVLSILALALPALFLALLVPKVKKGYGVLTAVTSGAIALLGKALGLPSYFIILPILVGVIAGGLFRLVFSGEEK